MSKKVGFQLIVLCLLALCTGISWAQDTTPNAQPQPAEIAYSTPVDGTIDNTTITQSWSLLTASADRITVHVERTNGNLIPQVFVLDGNQQILAQSYSPDEDFAGATINSFTLPAAGEFTIQVARDRGDQGTTTGGFKLTVTPMATGEDNPQNTSPVGPIQADTPVTGEITATHWYQRYTYDAQAGDTIEISAQRTSGTLFPEIEVLDVNNTPLTNGYTSNAGDSADTTTTLPAKGQYTVAITRAGRFNGDTLGGYQLTVKMLGAGQGSPTLVPLAGDVAYDKPLQGKITGARWYDDWKLTAQAGDTLRLIVERADGNLQPEVILLGGSGQEINHGYTDNSGVGAGARAEISNVKLGGPGSYTVRVSRASGQNGVSTGSYTLTVMLVGSGVGSPNLTTPSGAITVGTPVTGTLTGTRWMDTWTFEKTDDQPLVVTMKRTDGTLVPMVEIRDLNGQSIGTGYPEDSQDMVEYPFTLQPGKYQIVAERNNLQDGFTTGGYSLTVAPPLK